MAGQATGDLEHSALEPDLAALLAQAAALLATVAARLSAPPPPAAAPPRAVEPDHIVDAAEAAGLVGRSVSWLRKNGHRLPGFRQPGGPRTRVRWSAAALEEWGRTAGVS